MHFRSPKTDLRGERYVHLPKQQDKSDKTVLWVMFECHIDLQGLLCNIMQDLDTWHRHPARSYTYIGHFELPQKGCRGQYMSNSLSYWRQTAKKTLPHWHVNKVTVAREHNLGTRYPIEDSIGFIQVQPHRMHFGLLTTGLRRKRHVYWFKRQNKGNRSVNGQFSGVILTYKNSHIDYET